MEQEDNQGAQKKKLVLLVIAAMGVIVAVWALVLFPISKKKALDGSDFEADQLFTNLKEAKEDLDQQLEEVNAEEDPRGEEVKTETEVPRLPGANGEEEDENTNQENQKESDN